MSDLWAQRPDENARQYTAFWDYCTMGAGRSLAKLHAEYGRQKVGATLAKPPSTRLPTLEAWSSQFDWVARAAAWDRHQIDLEREALEQRRADIIAQEALHADWQLERWEQAWSSTPFHEQDVVQEVPDPNHPGQMMRVVVVRANVAKMQALTRWRRDISEQQRRAAGLPDKIVENKTEHSGKITNIHADWREAVLMERQQQRADAEPAVNGHSNGHPHDDDEPADW